MPNALLQFCAFPLCSARVIHGYCREHAVQQEHARVNYAVRRWYRTARWRHPVYGRRAVCLRHQPYCADCLAKGTYTQATEVHHIRKHNGDPVLFWDQENLMGLCAACHTAHTMRGE